MHVVKAFLVRDFRVAWSYRASFLFQSASLIFSLLSLRFVSDLFGGSQLPALKQYGGDYFSFALIGVVLSLVTYPTVRSFSQAVRTAQISGTLEAMLATRSSPFAIVSCSGLYPVVIACLQAAGSIAVAALLFGGRFQVSHLALGGAVLILLLVSLAGIGLMSAAFTIAFKQSEPITGAMLAASLVASGVLYPVSVLPRWLQLVGVLIPTTHAVEIIRSLLLAGANDDSALLHLAALALFCISVPLGLLLLRLSIDWAKRTGTLAQY